MTGTTHPSAEETMSALSILIGPAATLMALAVAVPALDTAPSAGRAAAACQGVQGDIAARAERLGLDLHGFKASGGGSIRGALQGDIVVEVRREGRNGGDTELSIRVTAATPAGPLRMEGRAIAAREHAGDPLHRVRGWLDVSESGIGATGPSGRLRVEGTADTSGRAIAVRYSGQLCPTPVVVHAVAPQARP